MMKFPAPERKKPKLAFSANISGAMGRLQEKEVKASRQLEVVPAHQQLWELERERVGGKARERQRQRDFLVA